MNYLNTKDLATLFGITRRKFTYRVRENQFPQPDLKMGSNYMWKQETVLTYLHNQKNILEKQIGVLENGL